MKTNSWMLIGTTLLVLGFFTGTQAITIEEPLPSPAGGDVGIEVSAPSPGSTRMVYSYPEMTTRSVNIEGENFTSVRVPGESHTTETGLPELPVVNRVIGIPDFGAVRVRVVSVEYTETHGIKVYPMQPWIEENQDNDQRPFTRNAEFYHTSAWYPAEIAQISEPAVMRDVRVAIVSTFPVQYNPATGTIRTYSSIEVVVEPTGEPGVNEKIRQFPYPSTAFMPIYRQLTNFELLDLDEGPNPPGSVLMLCSNNATVLAQVNLLAEWKRRRGVPVTVTTTSVTGTSYSQVASYVQTFYNTADPPLEYLILVGDVMSNSSDPFYMPAYSSSDFPYTQLAGGDILGDIAVGRLSVRTAGELNIVINKSIRYDRYPYIAQDHWFTRAYLLAGIAQSCASNVTTKEWVRTQLYRHGYDDVPLDTHYGHIPASTMRQQVGIGCTFFNWRGAWISEMSNDDLIGLSNGWMLPQAATITCSTGDFAGSSTCLSEAWLRYGSVASGNGAIGCIATATSMTHVNLNNLIDASYFYGFMVCEMPEAGMALLQAKFQFYRNYYPQQSGYVTNYFNWVNLMGDPELKTWTAVPAEVEVTYPATLAVGCNQVEVSVNDPSHHPIPDALVTAMGTSTYSRGFTNASGQVILPVTLNSAETLYITTWKNNHLPYEGQITVTQQNLWLGYQSMTIDDDNLGGTSGNSDGILNPAEIVDLSVTIHNYGSSLTATDIVGTLTTLNTNTAQVITSTRSFPNLAPGASATSVSPFRVQIVGTAQDQAAARFLLEITSGIYDQTSLVEATIVSGELEYVIHQFTTSNNRLDPGETETMTVTVNNIGHRNLSSVTGTLFSSSNFVSFPLPQVSYGAINQGANATNTVPFQISANPMTFPGARATIGISFQGASSFFDSTLFTISIGQISTADPTGPDDYGYYAFDNTDTDYEMCPTYEWIEIDPTYGGSGTNLPLSDIAEDDDDAMSLRLPFTFKMYGIPKDTLTVCTNGWVALGDQRQFVNFRNWHVPGPQGPDLMICPFWDELITTGGHVCAWHDAVNGYYIIQWSRMRLRFGGQTETFQVILYDPAFWPTLTGDGLIKFQYHTIYQGLAGNYDNDYATIGIENDTQDIGLELSYWNNYSPGAASVQAQRAYLITNQVTFQVGALEGVVRDAATGNPIVGAMVTAGSGSYWDTTDASGYYFISDMLINDYELSCSRIGYNSGTSQVTITENDTLTRNFDLLHPEFLLDVSEITATLTQGDSTSRPFHLSNNGNGLLDYSITMDFHLYDAQPMNPEGISSVTEKRGPVAPPGGTDNPWDRLLNYNVTFITGDHLIQGAAFAWGSFWVVGGGVVSSLPNKLYQFDPMGNYVGAITLPSTSVYGYRDLAFDGEYLWGSEDQWIVAFDTNGVIHDSIPGQLNPNRCLAFDPGEDVLYTGDITAPIIVLDREGNEIRRYSDHELRIYGLAWFRDDPDGYPLYMFCQPDMKVYKLDPATGNVVFVVELGAIAAGDLAGGAMVTPSWNPLFYTFVGQIMGQPEDKIGIWEIAPNTAWITYSPTSGTVAGGAQQTFDVLLDAREIALGQYGVNLVFSHNAISQSDTLPIRLTITSTSIGPETASVPFTYSLDQNYPNPFNPTTAIPYSIRDRVRVRLDVYNILGQRVARLVDGVQDPGQYKAVFEANTLSSGIYFYKIEAGTFSLTRKMVILK